VTHLLTFSCLVYAKELNQVRKLDDRSQPGVFIRYVEGAQRVRVTCDVVFDEGRSWD
jgi:hypothetical protein